MKRIIQIVIMVMMCLTSGIVKSQSFDTLGFVERIDSSSVVGYNLEMYYPNPFSPTYAIRFTIGDTSIVNLILCDTNWNIVSKVCDGVLNPGKYKFYMLRCLKEPLIEGYYIVKLDAITSRKRFDFRKTKFSSEIKVMVIR